MEFVTDSQKESEIKTPSMGNEKLGDAYGIDAIQTHVEDEEDSPIEEVRIVVPK